MRRSAVRALATTGSRGPALCLTGMVTAEGFLRALPVHALRPAVRMAQFFDRGQHFWAFPHEVEALPSHAAFDGPHEARPVPVLRNFGVKAKQAAHDLVPRILAVFAFSGATGI